MTDNKYLTVLVVPHDERNVRRLRLSYRWVKVGITAMGALAVIVAIAIASYAAVASRATRAALLERENRRLETENAKVAEIAENLERTERAYARIREMAGLPSDPAPPGSATGPRDVALLDPAGEPPPVGTSSVSDRVPAGWPLALRGFQSARWSGPEGHPGIDVAVPLHTAVLATAAGAVTQADRDSVYGNYVVIDHGGGLSTMYGHNEVLLVEPGERVTRGQPIAYSGNSGRSTAPHLHYEIRQGGRAIDPAPFLP